MATAKPRPVLRGSRSVCIAVLAASLFAPPAFANDRFAGDWVLDLAKSEGMRQKPRSLVQTVRIEDGNVGVHREFEPPEGEKQTVEFTYVTDGELHTIPAPRGRTRDVTAEWKGKKLVVRFEVEPREGLVVPIKETWRIKKGELLIKTNATTPMGQRVVKMYFTRP